MKLTNLNPQNSSFLQNKLLLIFCCLIILFILNLAIFWDHYFNETGFPLDFSKAYYARIAFASTLIEQGIFPQWVPFQQMGYPTALHPHFGLLYYPFFWVFPALSIPYTLHNAVVFQTLHIFAGSVGMFFFLNLMFKSYKYALLGAIAFQFFGGFFTNSPYPDMIRAYAIAPWMFYVFTLNVEKPTISRRALFIPIVVFVMTTGSYSGHFIASIFMMGTFIVFQSFNGLRCGIGKRKSFLIGIVLFSLTALGLVFSVIYLGPFLQHVDELKRLDEDFLEMLPHNNLRIIDFHHTFLRIVIPDQLGFAPPLYVGLPILVFASFVPITLLRKYWMFLVMMMIGILMVLENSFFYQTMESVFPPLGFSRRTIAEYVVFIVIPIFIFAIIGLKSILEQKIRLKTFAVRTAFIASWFSSGIFLLFSNNSLLENFDHDFIIKRLMMTSFLLIIMMSVILLFLRKSKIINLSSVKKYSSLSLLPLIFFGVLILSDGFITIYDNPRWKQEPIDDYYKKFDFQLEKNGNLVVYGISENMPDTRPKREYRLSTLDFAFKGYLDGSFIIADLSKYLLQRNDDAFENLAYRDFMRHVWTPLFIELPTKNHETKISLPENTFEKSRIKELTQTSVIQTHYGINDITYKVSLDEPKLMVENEIYFPGWTATLYFPDHEEKLQAIEVNDIFRGWNLPAGDYEMKASFEFPNYHTYQIISFSAIIIWAIILIAFIIKFKTTKIEN